MGRMRDASALLGDLVVFLAVFNPVLLVAAPGRADLASPAFHLGYWAQALPHVLLLAWLGRGREGMLPEPGLRAWLSLLGRSLAVALLSLALGLLVSLPWLLSAWKAGSGGAVLPSPPRPGLLPFAAFTSLLTGYREELFFRARLIPDLEDSGAGARAPLASALAFAALHLPSGPRSAAVALAVGLLLAYRFRARRDPHEVCLAHALYDFAVMAAGLA